VADFEILDDITSADVAVRFYGDSLEGLFLAGGRAVIAVMTDDSKSLGSAVKRSFGLESGELDLLLHSFLQEFVF
jgi:SHS2 domain-containing protein